ncbi:MULTISPECIES: M12 family metallo-peptidase [unclassified Spirosoma]|uniref:M12 family metallo-peptidase n=1 Tax=unclassified Spirosoma TaxID=2621999 RepID=UPI00095CF500|nr:MULTISPECIES: M12 family metallo-peptidase [unclassified Spirosoma]MBN8826026.1 T9SS type A sorting domain-containing protein [Spirosoma sp.]OJW75480.1 MAG: peptidase M12B ADAM/reprolysin [Spirosoma sp. 48-14]
MKNIYIIVFTGLLICLTTFATAQTPLTCGVDDRNLPDSTIRLMGQLPRLMAAQNARKAAGERNICRIAVEIDSDTYLEFEKDTNRIRSYFLERIEQASKIFEREINTQLVVVYFHIWKDTEPDPYRGELDMFRLSTIFSNKWATQFNQIPYDKRVYFPTKSVTGAGGLGGGNQAISANGTDLSTLSHELGHCFGSPHTHNCSWPGGPIDYCSTAEGDCYKGALQTIQGTIMSYCQVVNNALNITFHPLCQALMTDYAVKSLPKLSAANQAPVLPAQLALSGIPFMYWNGQAMAERYDVEVASDADFAQKIISDTTQVNGYAMSKLAVGQTYYVRVRSVNRLGTSAWSTSCQLQRVVVGVAAPILLVPTQDQRLIPYNNGICQMAVQPVEGATGYEMQFTQSTDPLFKYSSAISTSTASFTVSLNRIGTVLWRTRAIVGNTKGPWSATGRFVVNPASYYINLPFNTNESAPLTFPYVFTKSHDRTEIQMTLATDTTFAKPISVRTTTHTMSYYYALGMAENLQPNTQYYIKVEEWNTQILDYPTGLLTRTVIPFKTGSAKMPDGWSFINNIHNPDWPVGNNMRSLVLSPTAAWISTVNGITRISLDSLTVRSYTPKNTNGKIGNVGAILTTEDQGNVWLVNRKSVNVFKNSFAVPYYQLGKIAEQTVDLTEAVVYNTNANYSSISLSPKLFHSYNAIYEQKADTLAKFYTAPENRGINQTVARAGIVWILQYNGSSATAPYELVRLNTLTRTTQVFNADNTPQLRKYLNRIVIDGLGNLWVSQSDLTFSFPPLARYDGQTWTTFSQNSTMPISYVNNMASDPLGNLYVIDNASPRRIFKYDGLSWKKITTMPLNDIGTMSADINGNLWFSGSAYQVIRYSACANVATPTLTVSKQTIEIGESATLQAAGCSDVIWSWASETETVTNRLVRGNNQLLVKPEVNTTYRARCYTGSCAGADTTLSVTVLPKLSLMQTGKTVYCPGDSLTVGYGVQGKVVNPNQYWFVVKSAGKTTTLPATVRGGTVSMPISNTFTPGQYVFFLEASQPVVRTRDSLQITVSALPTAELSSNKLTFPLGDSARVSITLTGSTPWQFTRWDNQIIRADNSPYVVSLKANQPTNYSLSITGLSDANCATGTIKNSIVISALALANEPLLLEGISVYPNPVTDQITIELKAGTAPLARLQLRDEQGRDIRQKNLTGRSFREQWDMRGLPSGSYVLHIETQDGRAANWKVVKQ